LGVYEGDGPYLVRKKKKEKRKKKKEKNSGVAALSP
jgi:hypothetical protein